MKIEKMNISLDLSDFCTTPLCPWDFLSENVLHCNAAELIKEQLRK